MISIFYSQDFDRKWKFSLFNHFIDFLGCVALNVLNGFFDSSGIDNGKEINRNVKSTIAALCILNKSFANEKSRWRLIQSKEIGWLNNKLINKLVSMIWSEVLLTKKKILIKISRVFIFMVNCYLF